MSESAIPTSLYAFNPPRRSGLLFHGVLALALGGACTVAFMFGINQPAGSSFVLLLLLSLLLFAPLPWVLYRAYALALASYRLERDGLRLHWGMRAEDIPLPDVEWVRRPQDCFSITGEPLDLPLPRLHWPGAILGRVNVRDLGPVEYLAADEDHLLLVATPERIFAISPEDPQAFLRAFHRTLEMGSLTPLSSISVLPAAYFSQILADRVTRGLLASGFILNLLLLVGTSLLAGSRPASTQQLILLPILGAFIYVADLATGLFFYRRGQQRLIAYLVWASAPLTAVLLVVAALALI